MKNTIVSIFVISAILLSSCTIAYATSPTAVVPDWPDGTFHGIWTNTGGNNSGALWGMLNQGRRSTLGTFSGEWNTTDGTTTGRFQGIFTAMMCIGHWTIDGSSDAVRFFGFLRLNDTGFSGNIFGGKEERIQVSGTHAESFLPALTGPYGVGVKSMYLQDVGRPENFTADPSDVREMMTQIWYPIQDSTAGTRALYMDYPTFQWLKHRSPIPLVTIPNNAYLFVRPHERNNTSIAPGSFPVIIFSPGYTGVYQMYSSFIEDVVSHGFVVVSINHPYVSGITVFPDGRTVGLAPVPTDSVERAAFFNMSLRTVVGDAKFVLDTITEMNENDPDFTGHFDLSRVGMYGHSFGGANTAVCCYEDARFTAGLTLEGVYYPSFIPGNIKVPFLMMFAEARLANDTTVQYMWNHTVNDTARMTIAGSTHYAYTDVGLLLRHLVPLAPAKILGFGTIPPKRMMNITRTFVTTFFEVYLKDAPVDELLSLPSEFAEVQFEYKAG